MLHGICINAIKWTLTFCKTPSHSTRRDWPGLERVRFMQCRVMDAWNMYFSSHAPLLTGLVQQGLPSVVQTKDQAIEAVQVSFSSSLLIKS